MLKIIHRSTTNEHEIFYQNNIENREICSSQIFQNRPIMLLTSAVVLLGKILSRVYVFLVVF